MALYPITVNTSAESPAHIFAEDDAAIYQGIFRDDCVLDIGNKLKATVESNNLIKISDGVVCVGGHFARIKYGDTENVAIENGQTGKKRYDLIVARFYSSGGNDVYEIDVKKGVSTSDTPVDPSTENDDLYQGNGTRELALYRVRIDGLSIEKIDQLFHVEDTIVSLKEYINGLAPVFSASLVGEAVEGKGEIDISRFITLSTSEKYAVAASNGDPDAYYGIITGAHISKDRKTIKFYTDDSVSVPVRVNFCIFRVNIS